MTTTQPLIFYDISSPIQPQSYAPNPSKTRYALSLKNIPFKTHFTDLLDITKVRKSLNCPATRKLDDGSDFYTLPMLQNAATGEVIGDSFDIANYLDENYPESGGTLFPANSKRTGLDYQSPHKDVSFVAPITTNAGARNEEYAKFNWHVDTTFTAHVQLVGQFMPFNPHEAEQVKANMAKRAHLKSWEDTFLPKETRGPALQACEEALRSLAELYRVNDGPFLEGEEPNYADVIVGGWVNMFAKCMPEEEWKAFREWHGGVLARLHDALQERYWVLQ
ncbi:hypothetical protein M011DRAFT_459535 [Sporormia fimetaria CBS 119925]|uniref:GST N-terminal domain-containing protein n=1 Tax=Sporormia fimetaria CBS 119925 TaxID=1340428 RepID=A0A6A6V5Z3_9PLEO|nr:hypothetical protein M011DRAFT_459535 [Sporormia fimetaria CBS 119925]